jgi:tRNA (guanine-N7-)-methyltransferase
LYLFHPDPWPKKRHHKRRLIQPPFVEAAIRSMKAGARLLIQTDHPEYFEQIRAVLARHEALHKIDWEQAGYMPDEDWGGTNYEIKYAREGRKIFRIAAQKH